MIKKFIYFCRMEGINERQMKILTELNENGFVRVQNLCEKFTVSSVTIRKDLSFLEQKGLEAIEEQGLYTTNELGEHETPLVDGKDCAYVIYDERNQALCGIEEAYNQGVVDFKKPVSCHLYPVRIRQYSEFAAINYHKWEICDDACALGKQLQVPVYQFVKQALIRKFGEKWYGKLEEIAMKRNSK